MAAGKVKWFDDAKGYGFIIPADGGKQLFVHHTAIVMAGRRTLSDGQAVNYEIKNDPKGPRAIDVQPG